MNKAEELIACLEGEIAKRDERIVELEECLPDAIGVIERLRTELARVTQADAHYQAEALRLAAELAAIKAQGVIDFVFSGELPNATFVEVEDGNGNSINVGEWFKRDDGYSVLRLNAAHVQHGTKAEISLAGCRCVRYGEGNPHWPCPLHAAPVQQVSVPDVSVMARILADRNAENCNVNKDDNWKIYSQDYIDDVIAMLASAPAAPAADAWLVEALELAANRLDRLALEQGEFWRGYATAWADEARATANGVKS